MNRDGMKIKEFNHDDGDVKERPRRSHQSDQSMRIVEFDDRGENGKQRVARPEDVGKIKIMEFEGEPSRRDTQFPQRPKEKAGIPPKPRDMKIMEFGDDRNRQIEKPPKRPGIKIIEYD